MTSMKLLCLFVVAVPFVCALELSEEERITIKNAVAPIVVDCAKEEGEKLEQVKEALESKKFDNLNPCILSCIYKKIGWMTDDGVFDYEQTLPKSSKYVASGTDFSKIVQITKSCATVNDAPVTDGIKGCERAKLLADCMVQYRSAYAVV